MKQSMVTKFRRNCLTHNVRAITKSKLNLHSNRPSCTRWRKSHHSFWRSSQFCNIVIATLTFVKNERSAFPQCWNRSILNPILKVDEPVNLFDLRPIDILPRAQSGLCEGYSCDGALLDITVNIIQFVDWGELATLILLNYSKAFDTINHELLSILHYIGLGVGAVTLI